MQSAGWHAHWWVDRGSGIRRMWSSLVSPTELGKGCQCCPSFGKMAVETVSVFPLAAPLPALESWWLWQDTEPLLSVAGRVRHHGASSSTAPEPLSPLPSGTMSGKAEPEDDMGVVQAVQCRYPQAQAANSLPLFTHPMAVLAKTMPWTCGHVQCLSTCTLEPLLPEGTGREGVQDSVCVTGTTTEPQGSIAWWNHFWLAMGSGGAKPQVHLERRLKLCCRIGVQVARCYHPPATNHRRVASGQWPVAGGSGDYLMCLWRSDAGQDRT